MAYHGPGAPGPTRTDAGPRPVGIEPDADLEEREHAWPLTLPALAAWASALILLGCAAVVGMIVAVFAVLATCAVAWHTRASAVAWHTGAPTRSRSPAMPPVWRNVTLATLICAAAVSASVALRIHALTTGPAAELAAKGSSITARIALTDDPKRRASRGGRFNQDGYVVPATLETIQSAGSRQTFSIPITVFASGNEWGGLLPSQHLEVTGRLAKPTPGDLVAAVLLVRGPPRVLTPPSRLQTIAGSLRSGLRTAADVLPPDQRGLLPGLVVGDVSRMDPQVASDLRETGMNHLHAVSGANLAIVAGAALAISRLIGLSLPMRAGFAAVAMLAFAVVARPSPSVLRALLMGLVAAVALGTGRARDGFAALSATVLLLMLFAPELARSYGFALSVAATAGILILAPRWRDRLSSTELRSDVSQGGDPPGGDSRGRDPRGGDSRGGDSRGGDSRGGDPRGGDPRGGDTRGGDAERPFRLPRWLAEAVAVPAAAQVAVTPVLVLMSGQLTPVAVIANLLVAPAVAPATLLGFGAALVAPLWPDAASFLVVPAGYAVGWIITVAGWAVGLPFATLPWPSGLLGLGLLGLTVAIAVPILRRRAWRAMALTAAAAALVAVLVVRPITGPWPPKGWLMVMCDVGQGDGLVIAAGPGQGVVVDTGPDPIVMDRCLRRLGVDDVPLLVLTHPHADHVDGLTGVLRNRRVGAVVVSPQRTEARAVAHVSAVLAQRRIPEWTAAPGSRWRFGPSDLSVLAPDPAMGDLHGQGEGSAINNASVVLHVRWRSGSILLGGDLETEAQEELLRRVRVRADILKTPHHGSGRQSPAFLASLGARAALVSVGADNDYGHPAPSTLVLLRRLGATTYRTDQSGDLAVVERDGGLAVVARGL
ncbi:ComEC/Rec2 family competence protein [Nonomuraea polychroma]|uniref:ComEC/Rec2 family competence protein n=1 Tax=Nonomuraea polychroma TaxID=46176 RepID=UPI003D91396D